MVSDNSGGATPVAGATGLEGFLDALWERHSANLTFREIRRAAQAVSSVYVEGRGETSPAAAMASAGKRAAFAAYFGGLHLIGISKIVKHLSAEIDEGLIVDLGCGTGVAGAAWALAGDGTAEVQGVEKSPWAAREARWTLRTLGLRGRIHRGDATRFELGGARAVVAAYLVNEVSDRGRARLLQAFVRARRQRGTAVLVVEPIAKRGTPWWPSWAETFHQLGGREDTWRLPTTLPSRLGELDRATGLDHGVLKARTLFAAGRAVTAVAGSGSR